MTDQIPEIRAHLESLLEALEEFTAGNRDRLFDSRDLLRELTDSIVMTDWNYLGPLAEMIQRLLGNVLRYGVLGEVESVTLASDLLSFVHLSLRRPPPGQDQSKQASAKPETVRPVFESVDDTPLGEILVRQGAVTEDELYRALALQQITRNQLGQILMQLGVLTEEQLASGLAYQKRVGGGAAGAAGAKGGGGLELRLVSQRPPPDAE